MIVSNLWLKEWLDSSFSASELADKLTMAGLEVDAVTPAAPEFSGVVVGEVVDLQPHPDADKLRVATINVGQGDPLSVVCGAKNIAAGQKVPVATVGAVLPGNFKIKRSKLRGVESFGMVCSEAELGMAESADGILVLPADTVVGDDIREALKLEDTCIDIDLTPNRGDCLSVRGVARELSALQAGTYREQKVDAVAPQIDDQPRVEISQSTSCSHYVGRIVKNANLKTETPLWMKERLRRGGLRPISLAVDITNYVMLEFGQPMHAFDLDVVGAEIIVRNANANEKITLLDGKEIELLPDTTVIANKAKPLAIGGVMGGKDSGVADATVNVLLESAFFSPIGIAGKARNYGLHTDSSHRFERGVDPALQVQAIEYATKLLVDIAGGDAGPITEVTSPEHDSWINRDKINVRLSQVNTVLGVDLDAELVENVLDGLAIQHERNGAEWQCIPPSYRFDLEQEVDFIEEVARVYGYHNIPTRKVSFPQNVDSQTESMLSQTSVIQHMAALGFQEVVTYTFVDPELDAVVGEQDKQVALANPMSADMSVMRTSLWSSLLPIVAQNLNRQVPDLRYMEFGRKFLQGDELLQPVCFAGVLTGKTHQEQWSIQKQSVDFFDAKGMLESVFAMTGAEGAFKFEKASKAALHPGQSAAVLRDDKVIGYLGALHPVVAKQFGIKQPVYLFELEWAFVQSAKVPLFKPVSKFPSIRRDLSLAVSRDVNANQITRCVKSISDSRIKAVNIFDVYEGDSVGNSQKSIALSVVLQDNDATLTDADVDVVMTGIIDKLSGELAATIRE